MDSGNPSRRWRRGVERWLEPRNKHLVFAIALCPFCFKFSLTLYCFQITCLRSYFHSLCYIVCISSLHIIHSLFDQFSYNKVALCTSNPFKGNHEEGVQNLSRGIRLLVLFWEIVASFIHLSFKKIVRLAITPIHPPSRYFFSIGIRAWTLGSWLNNLREILILLIISFILT